MGSENEQEITIPMPYIEYILPKGAPRRLCTVVSLGDVGRSCPLRSMSGISMMTSELDEVEMDRKPPSPSPIAK
jgi:hypothetical protein